MAVYRKSNGGWVALGTVKRRSGDSNVSCQNAYRRQGGAWVLIWHNNVTGSASPAQFTGSTQGVGASGVVVSNTVTAAGANGSGSYTYRWTILSVDSGVNPTLATPNAAGTTMSRNVTASAGQISGYARCTITDANGSSSVNVDVPYTLSYGNRN